MISQSIFTLDVVIDGNILKWSIAYNNLAHSIDHDGSKTISTSTSFSTSYKKFMVSTIICLYFFSTYHSCGPLPFKGSFSLKVFLWWQCFTLHGYCHYHVDNNVFNLILYIIRNYILVYVYLKTFLEFSFSKGNLLLNDLLVMGTITTKTTRFFTKNKNKSKPNPKFNSWNKKNKNMICAKQKSNKILLQRINKTKTWQENVPKTSVQHTKGNGEFCLYLYPLGT